MQSDEATFAPGLQCRSVTIEQVTISKSQLEHLNPENFRNQNFRDHNVLLFYAVAGNQDIA